MARTPRHPIDKKLVTTIVKRISNPDNFLAKRDIPLFYKLYMDFPNPNFWKVYNPDWKPDFFLFLYQNLEEKI